MRPGWEYDVKVQLLETGEIRIVAVPKIPRNTAGFVLLWQEELDRLLTDDRPKLHASQLRVLLRLMADAEYGNRVSFFVSDLAASLSQHRIEVGKALRVLMERDYIRVVENRKMRPTVVLLDPELTFRGKPAQREQVRMEWRSLASVAEP